MTTWTDERIELCKRLWLSGDSATLVAKALGGVTRSAVIGKMDRLGVKRGEISAPTRFEPYPQRACSAPKIERKTGRGNSPGSAAARAIGQQRTPDAGYYEVRPTDVLSPHAAIWTERKAGQCAYPVDGEGADTRSCCNPADGTYCPGHELICYAGTPPKKAFITSGRGYGDKTDQPWAKRDHEIIAVDQAVDPDKQRGKFKSKRFGDFSEEAA